MSQFKKYIPYLITVLVIMIYWTNTSLGCQGPKSTAAPKTVPWPRPPLTTPKRAGPAPPPPPTFFENENFKKVDLPLMRWSSSSSECRARFDAWFPILNSGGDFGVKEPNGYMYSCAEWCATATECSPYNKRQVRQINMFQQQLSPDNVSRQNVAVECVCYFYGNEKVACSHNYLLDNIKQNYMDKCTKAPALPDVLLPTESKQFWDTRLNIKMQPTQIIDLKYTIENSITTRDGMVMRVTWEVRKDPAVLLGFLMVAYEEGNTELWSHMVLSADTALQIGSNKSYSSHLADFNEQIGAVLHLMSVPDYVFIREAYVRAHTVNNKAVPNKWTVKWKKTELPPSGADGKPITYDDFIGYKKFVIFMRAGLNQPWQMVWATPSNRFEATVTFVANALPTVGVLGETSGNNPCSKTTSSAWVPELRVNDVGDDQLTSMMKADSNIKHDSCGWSEICALEVRRGGGNCLSQKND